MARAAHDAVKEFEKTPPVLRVVNIVYRMSIKQFYRQSHQVAADFEEKTINNLFNQIMLNGLKDEPEEQQ